MIHRNRRPSLKVTAYAQGYQLAVQDRHGVRYYYRATPEGAATLAARLMVDGAVVIGRDALEALRIAA